MITLYACMLTGLFFFIIGIYIGLNEHEEVFKDPTPKEPLINLPKNRTTGFIKLGTVKRPSAQDLEEKNKPDRLKETEKAMEDTLDGIL